MKDIERTQEWLDERLIIANMENPPRIQDVCYYNGALAALGCIGYDYKIDDNGKTYYI